MKKVLCLSFGLLAGTCFVASHAKDVVVDVDVSAHSGGIVAYLDKIVEGSTEFQAMAKKIEAHVEKLGQEIEKLDAQGRELQERLERGKGEMSEQAVKKTSSALFEIQMDMNKKKGEAQQYMSTKPQEVQMDYMKVIREAGEKMVKELGNRMLFLVPKEFPMMMIVPNPSDKSIDITDKLLKKLNDDYAEKMKKAEKNKKPEAKK